MGNGIPTLLKAQKVWVNEKIRPQLSSYGAVLENVADNELRESMLATNVNILRRTAPYAYFFAGGYTPGEWSTGPIGKGRYSLQGFERKELQRGVWLAYPRSDELVVTTVFCLEVADVFPVVTYLNEDPFGLLCLPKPVSLNWIDQTIAQSKNNLEAIQSLLSDGGFLVSIIDYFVFAVKTYESQYAQYFVPYL